MPESDDRTADTLAILARLRSGWQPSGELADAPELQRWQLVAARPYLLQGWVGMDLKSGVAFALDAQARWARFIDRWVRLGAPARAQPLPSNDAVMRCAMAALAGRDEAADIGAEVRALAARSRDAGLDAAAYLLDLAALEADAARWPERLEHIGDHAAALFPRASERKARRARERSF